MYQPSRHITASVVGDLFARIASFKLSGFLSEVVVMLLHFYKTGHILQSDNANCTVLRAVVFTQYRRVTDGRTDGIAVASTALAMRALRRAVKIKHKIGQTKHIKEMKLAVG